MPTLIYEHTYSADHFERKFQANISIYEQNIEKPEEELIPLTEYDLDKINSEIKSMNEHIDAMLVKIHDKYDKTI